MPNLRDLTGMRFGKLVVIERAPNRNGKTYWKCRCDCGTEKEIRGSSLTSNKPTQSCGKCTNPNIAQEEIEKICPICGKKYKTKANNRIYCYDCSPSQDSGKARQKAIKHQLILYKGGKCERCGYDKCEGALQFHHLDPTQKDFGIAEIGVTLDNIDKLYEEVDKCLLLCANCHAEEHYQ